MKTYSINNLSEDQLRLIIESLLFSSSVSVNGNWYKEESEECVNLAYSLRKENNNVLLKNVFILKEKEYYDEHADEIIKYFPEILENYMPVL